MHVDNKVALITGASRGIGRATALELAKAGAKIVINYAGNAAAAQEVLKAIQDMGGQAIAVQANIAVAAEVDELIQKTVTAFGSIDILVNNAGITRDALLMRMKEADWDAVLGVNLKGGYFAATEMARRMAQRGQGGNIINIASVLGLGVMKGLSSYAISKAAMIQATKALALEFAAHNIRVNALAPGYIDTEINHDLWATPAGDKLTKRIPQRRVGSETDLDGAILLLASNASRYMTGSVITVDGGFMLT